MSDLLQHRGPDGSGEWADAGAGLSLGHRRLSILDPSPHGAQPMTSRDGRYVLCFNGEIYNHTDLRDEMRMRPSTRIVAWRGHSDTETLLEVIAERGFEATLPLLEGMFAFAVWDRVDRVLSLAIDRLGEKPLYYGILPGAFIFASELGAFKALPAWSPEINRAALAAFLHYACVPAPDTIYRDVWKLEPGCFLQVRYDKTGGHQMRRGRYWDLLEASRHARTNPFSGSSTRAVDALEHHLRTAVARQMRADVPLGAFLSGGVDSSTVVALMQAQSSTRIKTFTIGFDSKQHDETEDARRVAAHLGTDHTEARLDWRTALDLIPRLPAIWNEPFADASQLPTVLLSGLARQQVTVALSGDGGDELFGGYNRHRWAHGPGRRLMGWPGGIKRIAAAGLRSLSPGAWDEVVNRLDPLLPRALRMRMAGDKMHKLADALGARDEAAFYKALVGQGRAPSEILPGNREPGGWVEASRGWRDIPDPAERMMLLDLLTYLPGDVLTKVDRASMSVGLEARLPLLDPCIVDFALSLPLSLKFRDSESKWILRQVLYRYVPRALIERPKMGFAVPIADWLRGPLREWAEELLEASRLDREGYFDSGAVRKRWEALISGKDNHQQTVWNVLMFQAWFEKNRA